MDDTGNGEGVLAKTGGLPMVDDLKALAASEKPSTKRISRLTPDQALEILAQAVAYCNEAGVDVRGPQPFRNGDVECLVIVLTNVRLVDGRLVLVE
jgi:hypothetical protein